MSKPQAKQGPKKIAVKISVKTGVKAGPTVFTAPVSTVSTSSIGRVGVGAVFSW